MIKIVVMVVSLVGTQSGLFSYDKASYDTLEACNEARPAIVAGLSAQFLADKAPVKITQSACLSQDEIDKIKRKDTI